jgi:malonate transporter and related proteins
MIDLISDALTPIFLIILLGYFAGASGRIDNKHVTSLNIVVMNFALPAAMFGAVVQAPKGDLSRGDHLHDA